jgi:hypothetical protein
MKYNGLFLVPKPGENKTTQQVQPKKTTPPRPGSLFLALVRARKAENSFDSNHVLD